MANISIGGYTLENNPNTMDMVRPQKYSSSALTFDSVVFYNWGVSIIGVQITLTWTYMLASEFDTLDAIYQEPGPLVFDPTLDSGKTYDVQMISLTGTMSHTIQGGYRSNVQMVLLIVGEAT
jgi:hypothetical protein